MSLWLFCRTVGGRGSGCLLEFGAELVLLEGSDLSSRLGVGFPVGRVKVGMVACYPVTPHRWGGLCSLFHSLSGRQTTLESLSLARRLPSTVPVYPRLRLTSKRGRGQVSLEMWLQLLACEWLDYGPGCVVFGFSL